MRCVANCGPFPPSTQPEVCSRSLTRPGVVYPSQRDTEFSYFCRPSAPTRLTVRLAVKRLRFRSALISKRRIPPTLHHLLPRYSFELNADRDASNSVKIGYAGDSGLVRVSFTRSRTATVVVNCLTLQTASSTPHSCDLPHRNGSPTYDRLRWRPPWVIYAPL